MARDYICLYHSYLDAIQALGDAERGRLLTAMLEYSISGAAPQLGGNERYIFPMVKAQIDRDRERYEETCRSNSEKGKLGGRPRKSRGFSENPELSEKAAAFSKSQKSQGKGKGEGKGEGKDKGEDILDGVARPRRFTPPTIEEVAEYCAQRENNVDAQHFVDFYTAKGWRVGSNPMKDWKAAVRTWERRSGQYRKKPETVSSNVFAQLLAGGEFDE